ncbi:MAG: radical SAM protein [Bacillota bacterium]
MEVIVRNRKSKFVRLFDKTPVGVRCPHFYELILSNGCPFECAYCYLRLTFRGNKKPVLFCNRWEEVELELEAIPSGVFSTGELADSLAVNPPLLSRAIAYFQNQQSRYLLLTTKSTSIGPFLAMKPTPQVIISFSINTAEMANRFEAGAPPPENRLQAAEKLLENGWRVRIRLDPIIYEEVNFIKYKTLCTVIANLKPERVTVGTLRQYPGLHRFSPGAPRQGLVKATDGRLRYPKQLRLHIYQQIGNWLGFQPALCKETEEVWKELGWWFYGCNCTK